MLSDLPINSLSRSLKWLVWLIGATLLLLISSIASFNYMQSEASAVEMEELKRIENDTLLNQVSKRAITVANLMATPKKYHNQYVWVKGYLNLEFEGDAIYWRQKDYRANQYENSFYVRFTDSLYRVKPVASYGKHYVVIRGIFDANEDRRPGFIRNIESINTLSVTSR